jgi:hypothetical protein
MAYRFIQDANTTAGIPPNNAFQFGVTDVDDGSVNEKGLTLPYVVNPRYSFLEYQMWIECYLDAGMVLHKQLPQVPQAIDTLAVAGAFDVNLDNNVNGVNLTSVGKFTDTVQRMATSEYQFVLKGFALRVGYQIPVPGLKTVAGVPAIPGKLQWSLGNRVVGNYSGVPLFFNQWELWYFVAIPPKKPQLPPPNLGEHIRADAQLPTGMQVPWSQPDQQSQPTGPGLLRGL